MWQSIICILYLFNPINSFSNALLTNNDNNLVLPLKSQLSDLRAEQDHHIRVIEGLLKAMDIQILKSELDRQGKMIEGIVEDRQEKLINELLLATDIQSFRAELERLVYLIDGQENLINQLVVNVTDIQSVKSNITFLETELKQQNEKHETNYKSDIQSLKLGMEQQGQLLNEQRLLIDKQGTSIDKQIMLINEQRMLIEKQGILIGQLVKAQNSAFHPNNCSEAMFSSIYDIVVSSFSTEPFPVVCDARIHGGGWTVILRRMDGSVDFYRKWTEYQKGFGDLDGEFFIGLDKLHALTTERPQELLIVLEDSEGNATFAKYDEFAISDEEDKYRLNTLGSYSGTAGDSLKEHRGKKFTTFDNDNDEFAGNCAEKFTGAWWYNSCHWSNLAGKYNENTFAKGIHWFTFRGHDYSLKRAIMMIRPRK